MKSACRLEPNVGRRSRFAIGVYLAMAAVALLRFPEIALAAEPSSDAGSANGAVAFEAVPGSDVKRITLSAQAAERLGIETGEVSTQRILYRQMVGGRVIPPMEIPSDKISDAGNDGFSGFEVSAMAVDVSPVPAAVNPADLDEFWVLVTLSQGEWERVRQDQPAWITQLSGRDTVAGELMATPAGFLQADAKRSMLRVFYVVQGRDHGLSLNERVRVELNLMGDDEPKSVVPYSAVYYDASGGAWVYVNLEQLTYQRHPVTIDLITGDLAALIDGPAVGTSVVTVGAALLFGTEIYGR